MNINAVNNHIDRNHKITGKQQSFGSAADVVTQGLRYLNVNEAIGATLVDFSSMSLPRTIVDSKRGLDAGVETGCRENLGTLNHLAIGAIGGLSALALGAGFNKDYGVYSHSIFANNETIDILGQIWHENFAKFKDDKTQLQKAFYKEVLEKLKGLNSKDGATAEWVGIKAPTVEKLTEIFTELSQDEALKGKRLPKDRLDYLRNIIIADTGAEKAFKLTSADGKVVNFQITSFLDDLLAMGKAFSTDKVAKVFENSVNDIGSNEFIKRLKSLKMNTTLMALGISCAIGASVQPFNRLMTRLRTGNDGFVGVANNPNAKNKKSEKSTGFIAAKVAAAAGMLGYALASISTNFKDIPNKIQFKGKIPTLNQFKLVYGVTVASRFLAARSGDELRESTFKDILGFTNWLILGGFVAKGVVTAMDKTLLNSSSDTAQSGLLNWLKNKSIKTVDEVLLNDLAKRGVKTVTDDNKAIPFKQLLQKARELKMTDTLKKVRILNTAQIAGYLYSGIVLGVLIPKLNIKMTEWNHRESKTDNPKAQPAAEQKPTVETKDNTVQSGPFSGFIK